MAKCRCFLSISFMLLGAGITITMVSRIGEQVIVNPLTS
jgi:hypothetical protein